MSNKESIDISCVNISCRNSQGTQLTATVLRLKRYSVVFEVYNPYSILQTSEVLTNFRINLDNRVLYVGNATVSNIVNTGIFIVCEVTLEKAWLDVLVSTDSIRQDLPGQLSSFLSDWDRSNEVTTPMKLVTFEIENLFMGVRQWLERMDLGVRSMSSSYREGLEKDVFQSLELQIEDRLNPLVQEFCKAADQVPEGDVPNHKVFVRRQLHPFILCAPFLYRTYTKPLGYAGDFEMVNMILQQEFSGGSAFAKLINYTFLNSPPAEAHRNRIAMLEAKIANLAKDAAREGRRLRVYNLGCGPAEEIYRMMKNEDVSDILDITLIDFNEDTLKKTEERLTQIRQEAGRGTQIEYIQKSVHQVLRDASMGVSGEGRYDLVYCAGLFDYLSQKVCKKLVSLFSKMTDESGLVFVTNVSSDNPVSRWMEYMMEWNLIYRTDQEMENLCDDITANIEKEVYRDETGVNVFLEVKNI